MSVEQAELDICPKKPNLSIIPVGPQEIPVFSSSLEQMMLERLGIENLDDIPKEDFHVARKIIAIDALNLPLSLKDKKSVLAYGLFVTGQGTYDLIRKYLGETERASIDSLMDPVMENETLTNAYEKTETLYQLLRKVTTNRNKSVKVWRDTTNEVIRLRQNGLSDQDIIDKERIIKWRTSDKSITVDLSINENEKQLDEPLKKVLDLDIDERIKQSLKIEQITQSEARALEACDFLNAPLSDKLIIFEAFVYFKRGVIRANKLLGISPNKAVSARDMVRTNRQYEEYWTTFESHYGLLTKATQQQETEKPDEKTSNIKFLKEMGLSDGEIKRRIGFLSQPNVIGILKLKSEGVLQSKIIAATLKITTGEVNNISADLVLAGLIEPSSRGKYNAERARSLHSKIRDLLINNPGISKAELSLIPEATPGIASKMIGALIRIGDIPPRKRSIRRTPEETKSIREKVLALRSGLTEKEISQRIGVSKESVKYNLDRLREERRVPQDIRVYQRELNKRKLGEALTNFSNENPGESITVSGMKKKFLPGCSLGMVKNIYLELSSKQQVPPLWERVKK